MPPKGYRKGYIKDLDTGEYIDPITIAKKPIVVIEKKPHKIKKTEDDLGPTVKKVKDISEHPIVIISWKDKKGRSRTTQYVMAELTVNESISEEFHGAKKDTRIHLGLDGIVLEKN